MIKELAKEFECSPDTISRIIKLENLNTKTNMIKHNKKGIVAKDKEENIIKEFSSRSEAAK